MACILRLPTGTARNSGDTGLNVPISLEVDYPPHVAG